MLENIDCSASLLLRLAFLLFKYGITGFIYAVTSYGASVKPKSYLSICFPVSKFLVVPLHYQICDNSWC